MNADPKDAAAGNLDAKKPTHEVGYGKPPVATRFKKGVSGNRKGRKPGAFSLQTLIRKQLEQRVAINANGKRQSVTKKEAIAMGIVVAALKSDPKAIAAILQIEALAEKTPPPPDPNAQLTDTRRLDLLRQRLGVGANPHTTAASSEATSETPSSSSDSGDTHGQ